MKHTATPWGLHPAYPGFKVVANYEETEGSASYSEICNMGIALGLEDGSPKANAEFIVRACNCHEELVEAGQEALRVLELIKPDMLNAYCPGILTSDQADAIDSLKQALAKSTK